MNIEQQVEQIRKTAVDIIGHVAGITGLEFTISDIPFGEFQSYKKDCKLSKSNGSEYSDGKQFFIAYFSDLLDGLGVKIFFVSKRVVKNVT
jgi:hypothetical protein